jgi:hypothetical protein
MKGVTVRTIQVTERQAEAMRDVIDAWCAAEDMEVAVSDIQFDRTHETPESMLEAVDGMKQQFADLHAIREQLL